MRLKAKYLVLLTWLPMLLLAQINEVNGEILGTTNLATIAALATVENKIANISDLVIKLDYDAEIRDIKNKYFTTTDNNKFSSNIFNGKITRKKLVNETGLNEKTKALSTKEEIKKTATKTQLKAGQDKIVKLETYG